MNGPNADWAIEVGSVSKSYGKLLALDSVDLKVRAGSITGVVGSNGAGKTTLIRLLVGALRSDSGDISVLGMDPYQHRWEVRARVGYMPQAPVLYDDLSLSHNIEFFGSGHRVIDDGKVAAALELVDLGNEASRLAGAISGGQKQRVSLAATLVHDPEIAFLDEPTAGVDPELRHTFWQRFRELADAGKTLVVSTHQMEEIFHCDHVVVMRAGKVLASQSPEQLVAGAGAVAVVHTDAGSHEFDLSAPRSDLPQILRSYGLAEAVRQIDVRGVSLEEIILRLISDQKDAS